MKWIPIEDGYKSEDGRATITRAYKIVRRESLEIVSETRYSDGWVVKISKDGKPWKKGRLRLLKDAKRAGARFLEAPC